MTERRQLVLDFIKAYIRIHGIAPSYEVIAKGLGMKSKANIHRIIHRLQADGYLVTKPHKFHSIKIVDRSVREMASL
jgi:SOS-response transcriptional repressor LexA